jgi:GNAT superfamily N-acetyltransferase
MRFSIRPYRDDDDYWRLRAFLREVFLRNQRREASWQVARLDYWRFFGNESFEHYPLTQAITICEAADGRIAGFVTPESRGQAYLNVDPELRTPELEAAMLDSAEATLSEPDAVGPRQLTVWATQGDPLRPRLLNERGYTKGDWPEVQFGRALETPIPEPNLAPGYTIRALGDSSEIPARSWLSWRVFHPDEPAENYPGHDWYASIQRCPLYRRDLDLVAVTDDGDMAAFTTVWYDDVTRSGYFEPVGTSPDHERKGLARQIMYEGLRRLKALGAVYATVAGYSDAAIALYTNVMGPSVSRLERWQRTL